MKSDVLDCLAERVSNSLQKKKKKKKKEGRGGRGVGVGVGGGVWRGVEKVNSQFRLLHGQKDREMAKRLKNDGPIIDSDSLVRRSLTR